MFNTIRKMATLIRKEVYKSDKHKKIPFSTTGTRFNYMKKFTIPNTDYKVIFTHFIRGSLIEIQKDNIEVCSYVDQTWQWDSLGIGVNDIRSVLTKTERKEIITNLGS